tara:strand:- start:172 stop:1086 length:915 start_codon:yes stop_codon:yes gene_type:complete
MPPLTLEEQNKALQDQLDALLAVTSSASTAAAAKDPTLDYFAKMKALQTQSLPSISSDDISKRAEELSMLMPTTRRRGLYGLASDLSQGLVQQAASGRPSSVGYGLAAGFNLYSEAAAKRQDKAEEMRTKLMQMAYADIEKKREDSKVMQNTMLDAQFKFDLQNLKEGGGSYKGTSTEATDLNIILEGERDPSLKNSPAYKLAKARLEEEKRTTVQTERGLEVIITPGLDIEALFGRVAPTPGTSGAPAIGMPTAQDRLDATKEFADAGYTNVTFIRVAASGDHVYSATDPTNGATVEIAWSPV